MAVDWSASEGGIDYSSNQAVLIGGFVGLDGICLKSFLLGLFCLKKQSKNNMDDGFKVRASKDRQDEVYVDPSLLLAVASSLCLSTRDIAPHQGLMSDGEGGGIGLTDLDRSIFNGGKTVPKEQWKKAHFESETSLNLLDLPTEELDGNLIELTASVSFPVVSLFIPAIWTEDVKQKSFAQNLVAHPGWNCRPKTALGRLRNTMEGISRDQDMIAMNYYVATPFCVSDTKTERGLEASIPLGMSNVNVRTRTSTATLPPDQNLPMLTFRMIYGSKATSSLMESVMASDKLKHDTKQLMCTLALLCHLQQSFSGLVAASDWLLLHDRLLQRFPPHIYDEWVAPRLFSELVHRTIFLFQSLTPLRLALLDGLGRMNALKASLCKLDFVMLSHQQFTSIPANDVLKNFLPYKMAVPLRLVTLSGENVCSNERHSNMVALSSYYQGKTAISKTPTLMDFLSGWYSAPTTISDAAMKTPAYRQNKDDDLLGDWEKHVTEVAIGYMVSKAEGISLLKTTLISALKVATVRDIDAELQEQLAKLVVERGWIYSKPFYRKLEEKKGDDKLPANWEFARIKELVHILRCMILPLHYKPQLSVDGADGNQRAGAFCDSFLSLLYSRGAVGCSINVPRVAWKYPNPNALADGEEFAEFQKLTVSLSPIDCDTCTRIFNRD